MIIIHYILVEFFRSLETFRTKSDFENIIKIYFFKLYTNLYLLGLFILTLLKHFYNKSFKSKFILIITFILVVYIRTLKNIIFNLFLNKFKQKRKQQKKKTSKKLSKDNNL